MQPVQLTLQNCKLSLTPLPSGPQLEFTDFETDITWLSGPIYARLVRSDEPSHTYHTLDRVSWETPGDVLCISGRLGPLGVKLNYHLVPDPLRLEEKITLINSGERAIGIEDIRIGATWTPPKSWWAYWAYWRLAPIRRDIPDEFDRDFGLPLEKVKEQKEDEIVAQAPRLQYGSRPGCPENEEPILIGEANSEGWIFSDGKRFLVVLKQSSGERQPCPLDIRHRRRPAPTLIMGGVAKSAALEGIEHGSEWESAPTMFVPGMGGWREGFAVFRECIGAE